MRSVVPAVEAPSPERTGAGGVLSIHLIFAFRKTGKLSLEFREGNGLFCWSRCSVWGPTEELWDCWCGDRLSTRQCGQGSGERGAARTRSPVVMVWGPRVVAAPERLRVTWGVQRD